MQSEMKDTLIEIENSLQGYNSRVDEAENQSVIWYIRKQKQPMRTSRREMTPKNEDSISSLWDNFKRSNIHITRMPEGEEK